MEELLLELLRIPSPSGCETVIAEFLERRLAKTFTVERQRVGTRWNLLAMNGTPRVLFTTHMDTVPGGPPVREDADAIYGRGACDAKGSIAAMVVAIERAAKDGLTDFGLLLDVGEEDDFCGVNEAVKFLRPEVVVLGEPTDGKAVIGQKGLLGVRIRCEGKSAHGSTPGLGVSAIDALMRMLVSLSSMELPYDIVLGKTTMNVGLVNGGSSANMVAQTAEATIEYRLTVPTREFEPMLRERIASAELSGVKIDVETLYTFDPVRPSASAFLRELSFNADIVPYFTELWFWSGARMAFVYGPGESKYAHTDEERILRRELRDAVEIYSSFLTRSARASTP